MDSVIYWTGAVVCMIGALLVSVLLLAATWWVLHWLLKKAFHYTPRGPAVWQRVDRPAAQKVTIYGWLFNVGNRAFGLITHSVDGVDKSRTPPG